MQNVKFETSVFPAGTGTDLTPGAMWQNEGESFVTTANDPSQLDRVTHWTSRGHRVKLVHRTYQEQAQRGPARDMTHVASLSVEIFAPEYIAAVAVILTRPNGEQTLCLRKYSENGEIYQVKPAHMYDDEGRILDSLDAIEEKRVQDDIFGEGVEREQDIYPHVNVKADSATHLPDVVRRIHLHVVEVPLQQEEEVPAIFNTEKYQKIDITQVGRRLGRHETVAERVDTYFRENTKVSKTQEQRDLMAAVLAHVTDRSFDRHWTGRVWNALPARERIIGSTLGLIAGFFAGMFWHKS